MSLEWFENLFGFKESPELIRENIKVVDDKMMSKVNNKQYQIGIFEMQNISETMGSPTNCKSTIESIVSSVDELMAAPENAGSVFQVASQFNCLEFISPTSLPENGVTAYVFDKTQGPACSVACGPATVYRNYFVPINNQIGQSKDLQLNGLQDIENELDIQLVKNGYFIADQHELSEINCKLSKLDIDKLKLKLKVGVHWNTQVTSKSWGNISVNSKHTVTQVFGSALAIAYSPDTELKHWKPLASLVLEASYLIAFNVAAKSQNKCLYLTMLGGGVFGNPDDWIFTAIRNSFIQHRNSGLTVKIVNFRNNPTVDEFVSQLNRIE